MAEFAWEELSILWRDFLAIDKDRSGTVSLPEFRSKPEFQRIPAGEIDRCFKAIDSDGSGQLSFEEYVAFMSALRQRNPQLISSAPSTGTRKLTVGDVSNAFKAFNVVDDNNSGSIVLSELFLALRMLNPSASYEYAAGLMAKLDADGSGTVSFDEFLRGVALGDLQICPSEEEPIPPARPAARAPAPPAPATPARPTPSQPMVKMTQKQIAQAARAFTDADEDESGSLDLDELFVVLRMMNGRTTRADAERFMRIVDKDGSNEITLEEFLTGAKEFQWDFSSTKAHSHRSAGGSGGAGGAGPSASYSFIEINYNELSLGKKLGEGTFGRVFKGRWRGTEVAIKELKMDAVTPEVLADFRGELQILSTLRHPNCVLFLSAATNPPHLVFVTEFLNAGSLYDAMHDRHVRIDAKLFTRLALDMARGICYLHKSGVVHRDLKSLNILVDEHFTAKICDFGLSKVRNGNSNISGTVGTPLWMAPELLLDQPYTEKVDTYAFGLILWEMLTGKLPFEDLDPVSLSLQVAKRKKRPVIPSSTSPAVRSLIEDCWQHDPAGRPDFEDIIRRLEALPH